MTSSSESSRFPRRGLVDERYMRTDQSEKAEVKKSIPVKGAGGGDEAVVVDTDLVANRSLESLPEEHQESAPLRGRSATLERSDSNSSIQSTDSEGQKVLTKKVDYKIEE